MIGQLVDRTRSGRREGGVGWGYWERSMSQDSNLGHLKYNSAVCWCAAEASGTDKTKQKIMQLLFLFIFNLICFV